MRGKAAMMPSVIPVVWLVMRSALPATPADECTHGVMIVTIPSSLLHALILISKHRSYCWGAVRELETTNAKETYRAGKSSAFMILALVIQAHRHCRPSRLCICSSSALDLHGKRSQDLFKIAQPITVIRLATPGWWQTSQDRGAAETPRLCARSEALE